MARKWWTLVLSSLATFMLLLDITVVNVALPDIQRDLGASLSSLQWVVDAYSLMLAAFLLTAGSLGDRLGRRRVFSLGLGLFTFASFLCGIAGDPTLLNLARGLQGIGGAALRTAIGQAYPEVARLELVDYKVRILDQGHGTDAITRVLIETSDGAGSWVTVGVGHNVIEASWEALLDAVTFGLRRHHR